LRLPVSGPPSPPQLTLGVFQKFLRGAVVLESQRYVLSAFVEAPQHVISFGPTRASAGCRSDHLQTSLGFRPTRCTFLLQGFQPLAVPTQFLNQYRRVGRVKIPRAIDAPFDFKQIPTSAGREASCVKP